MLVVGRDAVEQTKAKVVAGLLASALSASKLSCLHTPLLTGVVTAVHGEEGANNRCRGDLALCRTVNTRMRLPYL